MTEERHDDPATPATEDASSEPESAPSESETAPPEEAAAAVADPGATAPPPTPPAAPAPQPAVAWEAPPPPTASKGERTGYAMAAGILLVLGGVGGIILGLLIAIVGGSVVSTFDFSRFGNISDLNGANPGAIAGGVVAFFGALIVAYSIAYLLAGIGVLRNASWGRVLGIVVGIISGLVWLSGLASRNDLGSSGVSNGGGPFTIVALAIHLYIVVVLLFFWRSKPATA